VISRVLEKRWGYFITALLCVTCQVANSHAAETLVPGSVSNIVYDETGLSVQLSLLDGSIVTTTETCGIDNIFRLSSTHANYKALVGALVSAKVSSSFVTMSLDGCLGTESLITSLQMGTTPAPPSSGTPYLMSSDVITGTGAFQEFHTNIDTITNKAMVITRRTDTTSDWAVFDTERGANNYIRTNSVTGQLTDGNGLSGFLNSGHAASGSALTNALGGEYLHLTFQGKEKFFDVVKYTGVGGSQTINHALNNDVGMIWVKNLSSGNSWMLWHRSYSTGQYVNMSVGNAQTGNDTAIFSSLPTSTSFSVGSSSNVNRAGDEYVAYLFAHNPANQVYAGRYSGTGGAGNYQNIGFEPQFIFYRDVAGVVNGNFLLVRSLDPSSTSFKKWLLLDKNNALSSAAFGTVFDSNGFSFEGSSGNWGDTDIVFLAIGAPQ